MAPLVRCVLPELLRGISRALAQGGLGVGWGRVEGHVSARGDVLGRIEEAQSARVFLIVLLLDSIKAVIELVRA